MTDDRFTLRPIRTEADYQAALKRVEPYFDTDPEPDSDDGAHFEALIARIMVYEAKHFLMLPPDPIEAIKFSMQQQGLSNRDLEPMIGSRGRVSEVLSGKRRLGMAMVWRLHERELRPLPRWASNCAMATYWRSVMTSKAKFKSDAFEAIHSAAQGLQRAGTIDKATMRGFDESCLAAPPEIAPKQIKRIREQARVSQPVFARYLNTSESTVQKWEAGTERPSGMALKLLAVVEKHGLQVLA